MSAINGDQDISKDETHNDHFVVSKLWWRYKTR